MKIDAHQHFWELGRFEYGWLQAPALAKIRRNFLPPDLSSLLWKTGVQKTVFVQTQHNLEENRWALGLAKRHDFIAGVVGWVDLASPRCEEQLLESRADPRFVGVRHVTHDEPDDGFIVREDVLRGLRVLQKHRVPFDLLFFTRHLKHAATLARALPELPMVIDHLAKPKIKDGLLQGWKEDLKAAAAFPNVHCKLSGMVTEADWEKWKPSDLRPYVQRALEYFGPDRCMFGSDWPVCELAASYDRVHDALDGVLGPLTQTDRAKIWGGTAAKFYNLKV